MAKKKYVKLAMKELRENQESIKAIEDPSAQKAIQKINDVFLRLLEEG